MGKYHVVDTTSALATTNPIFSIFEIGVAGMSDEVSINARIFASIIGYLGLGSLISRGRDFYRKVFKVKDTISERVQWVHDTVYLTAVNFLIAPAIYSVSEADLKQIVYGTLSCMGLSLVNGYILGGSYDIGRDLTGLKESKRLPEKIRKLPKKTKIGIAISLLAALVALNGAIYKITPDNELTNQKETTSIETIIQQKEHNQSIDALIN